MTRAAPGRMWVRSKPTGTPYLHISGCLKSPQTGARLTWRRARRHNQATSRHFTSSISEVEKHCGCATLSELDPALHGLHVHTGYDAWDPEGRFYFASFNGQPDQRVILTR